MIKAFKSFFWGGFLCVCACLNTPQYSYFEKILLSSKGEKVYIRTISWGVTGDYKSTLISNNNENGYKNLIKDRAENDFIYSFYMDTLILYFNQQINYQVKDTFKTISIEYKVLNNSEFSDINHLAIKGSSFYNLLGK